METSRGVATWLELAVAPEWRVKGSAVKLHALGGRQSKCFAISVDDRWLCAGNGALTVFQGLAAALHFLKLLRVEDFEPGEPVSESLAGDRGQYCLRMDRQAGLQPCEVCQPWPASVEQRTH